MTEYSMSPLTALRERLQEYRREFFPDDMTPATEEVSRFLAIERSQLDRTIKLIDHLLKTREIWIAEWEVVFDEVLADPEYDGDLSEVYEAAMTKERYMALEIERCLMFTVV